MPTKKDNSTNGRNKGMIATRELVAQCAPWGANDEDYAEHEEYLASLLSSHEDDYAGGIDGIDRAQLYETIDQFFESSDASRRLLDLWEEALNDVTAGTCKASNNSHGTPAKQSSAKAISSAARMEASEDIPPSANSNAVGEKAAQKTAKSKSRASRRDRKQKKKKCQPSANSHERTNEAKDDKNELNEVVTKIQTATDLELDELDDFSSAWKDARDGGRVWGGRGFGGRGVNRGLGTYKGKDAVVNGLTMTLCGKELLLETHMAIVHGHRYGLYGKNGVGKSTLLRRIAKGLIPGWPLHLSVKMVEQEVLRTKRTVRECVSDVQTAKTGNIKVREEEINNELAEVETMLVDLADEDNADALEEVSERMSQLYEELEGIERSRNQRESSGDESTGSPTSPDLFSGLDESAVSILKGLQFKDSMLDTPVCDLSGGWRMRVALAEALYSNPDILLMDEPTNHLDCSANIFLVDYILEHNLTAVVVSHDSHFLDAVCTDIIKFENKKLEYHVGNYSTFRDREEQKWATNSRVAEATAKKEQKAKDFISKQKSMSNSKHRDDNKQRQAKERQKKLSRIGLYNEDGKKFKLLSQTKGVNRASHIQGAYTNAAGFQSFHVDNSQKAFGEQKQLLNFRFPSAEPLKGVSGEYAPLITMDSCRFRYENSDDQNEWLLRDMTLNVLAGSRIAILGKNGSGKSTLVRLLCGELLPDSKAGEFHRHSNLRIAHISQHHIEQLGSYLEQSPVEYFLNQHNAKNELEARQFLGGFGLIGSLALQPIGTLSGGQKARLTFATVMYTAPHVLILDEPSNHLDSDSLSSLAEAIVKFKGAVVTVSHNQEFLSRISREVWTLVGDGHVQVESLAGPIGEIDTDDVAANFDELYTRYKEHLRREARKDHRRKERIKPLL